MNTLDSGEQEHYVIVGGGLAGASAAHGLRDAGFTGRITIIAGENEIPYIRPPLSKEYLSGAAERDSIFVHDREWYAERDIRVLTGLPVVGVSITSGNVTLEGGGVLGFDKLLFATGARSRRFPGPGAELTGVYYLRTVGESEALHAALAEGGKRVVILGSGWIGLEVASAARGFDNEVTVLGREAVPLIGPLGREIGGVFDALHRANGVDLRNSTVVQSIEGVDGVATGVRLDTGELLSADVVVVGVGALPNAEIAETAGLTVENGIVVDEGFRTSHPDIYAAGDVANVFHPIIARSLRVEHWATARDAGEAAGRSMAGVAIEYMKIPYFYTDQFDLGMEYSGYGILAEGAELVIRGELEKREFIALWLRENRVIAGMNVNVWDVNDTIQALIREERQLDASALADTRIALESFLASAAR